MGRRDHWNQTSGQQLSTAGATPLGSAGPAHRGGDPYIPLMILDLTDEEAAVLAREPTDITFSARYQLSPRVKTLSAILTKLRPQAARPAVSPAPQGL